MKPEKNKQLHIRLKAKEHEAVKAYCQEHGLRVSELVRAMFSRVLPPASFYSAPAKGRSKSRQLNLRLSAEEFEALRLKTKKHGYELETQFIYSLLHNLLFGQTLYNDQEVETAHQAAMELAAIGRNLNQVAKALNAGLGDKEKLNEVLAMRRQVLASRNAILRMLIANQRRF